MAEAIGLILMAMLMVVTLTVSALMALNRALTLRERKELEVPASERHRKNYVQTGDIAELAAMEQAIEKEEGH